MLTTRLGFRPRGPGVSRRRIRLAVYALAPLAALMMLIASASGMLGSRSTARRVRPMSWVLTLGELGRLRALDPALAARLFDTPETFALSAGGSSAGRFDRAMRTVSFGDENALARAADEGRLGPGARAVIYDDEHWSLTPLAQQLHPALYYRRAVEVAHRHGLLLIATPAADLVSVLAPGTPKGRKYAEFLKLGIAAAAARYADVYDIQAQGSEAALATYVGFVRAAAAQARDANPIVEVLAGIATNPSGQRETAAVMLRAVLATRSLVSGYWLNDGTHSQECPKCTGPYTQVAIAFLRQLAKPRSSQSIS